MSDMVLMYGAPPPYRPTWPQLPQEQQDPSPLVPMSPISVPVVDPAALAKAVAEAMKPSPGKIDPPPAGADRETEAIRAVVTAVESLNALIKSLAEQLTEAERARVLRYLADRIPNIFPFPKEEK